MNRITLTNLSLNCRRLFLRDFEVNISIGIHDFEMQNKQKLLVDVDLYIPLEKCTPKHDTIDEVFDYDFMRDTILEHTSAAHTFLQETICDTIAKKLFENTMVKAVRVSTRKTEVYPNCSCVGVEVFLSKE